MGSVIVLSMLIVAMFVVLCYLFSESRIELDAPTIAAMEARAESFETTREDDRPAEERSYSEQSRVWAHSDEADEAGVKPAPLPPTMDVTGYEYREMLKEGGDNYVLPQWMVNFFSSSDICHTLDSADNVVFVAKLNDARNADAGIVDFSADCDMSTQTIALKLCFGQGAAAETLRTKFYLFERGDLYELNRLARQREVRLDILARAADYTLEYACTIRSRLPQAVLSQLKDVLAKIPT